MQTDVKLYSLDYNDAKSYIYATLFVIGNIILPQLAHLVPQGGVTWLPIYFFTLIAAYKYGWKVGLLTAVASPVVNSLLFGMPPVHALPVILVKSVCLALVAGYASKRFSSTSLAVFALVIVAYQFVGSLFEFAYTGSAMRALQDVRIGLPGLLVQIFGGYLFINCLMRK